MKIIFFRILCLLFILVFGFVFVLGQSEVNDGLELIEGKNHIEINSYLYAHELLNYNEEIEYVSYYDEFLQEEVGYVSYFGGVGSNFLIEPGIQYEIYAREDLSLKLG